MQYPSLSTRALAAAITLSGSLAGGVNAAVVSQSNTTTGFFDDSSGTRDVTFTADQFAGSTSIITDINISVYFAKSDNNSFVDSTQPIGTGTPFYNETEIVLISPAGTMLTLISNDGGTELVPEDNFQTFNSGSSGFRGTITFDQDAPAPVDVSGALEAGTFRPDDETLGSLDSFNGQSATGVWSLFLEDDVGSDGLSFYSYTINITTSDTAPLPEPSSSTLLGLGILGLIARRRR